MDKTAIEAEAGNLRASLSNMRFCARQHLLQFGSPQDKEMLNYGIKAEEALKLATGFLAAIHPLLEEQP